MSMTARVSKERGQVVLMFAILLPVLLGLGSVVIALGNWYVHKRHLQTQVDAAVLAAGTQFVGCFLDPAGTNDEIRDEALRYAGDTLRDPTTTNLQVQEPNDVRVALNSASYWSPANGTNVAPPAYGLDYTLDGDPSTPAMDSSHPCDAKFLEAKATDYRAPLIFRWIPLFPSPKAKAKVEIRKLEGLSGFLPWAVPENNPKTVAALWVDETASDTVASWTLLTGPPTPQDTETLNGETVAVWDGLSSVNVTGRTGMIVFQSRQTLTNADFQGKTLSQICSMPTATCDSGNTNTSGVQFIRGTPLPGGNPQVTLTQVELTTAPPPPNLPNPGNVTSCASTDPDSAPYFLWSAECSVRIRAQIEFGNLGSPREVRVNGGPFGNKCNGGTLMELQNGWWDSPWLPSISAESGRNGYFLCWKAGNGNNAPQGNFGGQLIQMVYAAQQVRPLVYTAIRSPGTGCTAFANALAETTQTVCVEVGLQPPLRVTDGNDPPIFLRVAGSGSLNQALDCDSPPIQLDDEVRDGCRTPYKVNTRDLACSPDPTYAPNNLPPPLPPPNPDPWPDCIEANPGQVAEMAKGLRQRFEDPAPGFDCPPNQWAQYRATGDIPPPEDKRWVTLVVSEYGTFDPQGITVLPITKFAGFYATGWFIGGGTPGTQGCPDNDPPPTPPFCPKTSQTPCDADDTAVQGAVWGYFITDVKPPSGGTPAPQLCNFDELGTCIAVLVE